MARTTRLRELIAIWPRSWTLLLVICVLVIGAVDAALLELGKTYFSGGYNGVYIDRLPQLLGFFASSALLDIGFVLGIWALLLPVVGRFRLTGLRRLALVGIVTLAIPLSIDYANYTLHHILGDMVAVALLWEVSGRSATEMAAQALPHLHPMAFGLLIASVGGLLALRVAGWLEARFGRDPFSSSPPGVGAVWIGFLAAVAISASLLFAAPAMAPRIHFGLATKASSSVLSMLIQRVTDLDRDGSGLLSRPRDSAPLDASIHPYALDLPGNGIDDNGMAGDHPVGFRSLEASRRESALEPVPGDRRPHFLLIFLEGFRADLIGARLGRRELTPFLNDLAETGASSSRAYVNVPATAASRAQLFTGRLVPQTGHGSLIDDFRDRGYRVAYFSGQDDSWGGSEAILGVERADVFYDARQDVGRRTSRSSSPVSLQISWKLLNERVLAFLETQDPTQPLFLYVNFVDTHFPYHHAEIDNLLGIDPIARYRISADEVDRIQRTYANTAANVDLAVRKLVEAWTAHLDGADRAILVTADHGQAIFDRDFLGHGQGLTAEQTKVPLILSGIGGNWPEPIGLADIRDQLRRHLFRLDPRGTPRARFVPDPEREIFQFLPRIDKPRVLALRGLDRAVFYDLGTSELSQLARTARPAPNSREAFRRLIHEWEAVRLDAEKLETAGARSATEAPDAGRGARR